MPATLWMGAQGPDVTLLQRLLSAAGAYTGAPGGRFDGDTLQAVRTWQEMRGLSIDGIVGPRTWASFEDEVPLGETAGPNYRLTPNFQLQEFACNHCQRLRLRHLPELADRLQALRNHFGRPVYITSAYRCAAHNAAVGGVPTSYHTRGMATDVQVGRNDRQVPPNQVAAYARTAGWGGVGIYPTFNHLDVGPRRDFERHA